MLFSFATPWLTVFLLELPRKAAGIAQKIVKLKGYAIIVLHKPMMSSASNDIRNTKL